MTKQQLIQMLLSLGVLCLFAWVFFSMMPLHYSTTLTSEMSQYYLDNLSQTGAVNAVSAILLDFRAYDTLGEILVLFATISGVMLIARREP